VELFGVHTGTGPPCMIISLWVYSGCHLWTIEVNTQTHTDRQLLTGYAINSDNWGKNYLSEIDVIG